MNRHIDDIDIDRLLKEHFSDYKVAPTEEHWKTFDKNYHPKVVFYHKFKQLRVTLYASVVVVASVIAFFLFTNTEGWFNSDKEITKPVVEQYINKQQDKNIENKLVRPSFNRSNKVSVDKYREILPKNETTDLTILSKSNNNLGIANSGELDEVVSKMFYFSKLKGIPPVLFAENDVSKLDPIYSTSHNQLNTEKKTPKRSHLNHSKHSKPLIFAKINHSKKNYASNKHKHSVRTNYNNLNSSLFAFLSTLDFKVVAKAQHSGRIVHNRDNIGTLDFDQQYFKDAEQGEINFAGGIELLYPLKKQWSIYTGLGLTQYDINTKSRYAQLQQVSTGIVLTTSAGEINLQELVLADFSQSSIVSSEVKLNFLEMPLVLRKQVNNLYFDGGLFFSRLLNDRTTVDRQNMNFSYQKISDFRKNNVGLIAGTGLTHVAKSGIKLDIGAEIKCQLTSLNTSGYIINQPFWIGIKTGVSLNRYQQ